MNMLHEAAIFLLAAILIVPLFNRLGLGSVLGYLIAGIVIGPWSLGLISNVEDILHFAELGVILLLFLVGLELQPSRLWVLRRHIFGLGAAQVLTTAAVLTPLAWWVLSLDVAAALVTGLGLSLSSTAFVLQSLAERRQLTTLHGRSAFSILMFQDLAVAPMLALLPLLGARGLIGDGGSVAAEVAGGLAAFALLIVAGHYLLRPAFRIVATTGGPEIFTAAALLVVIGAALVMETVGLSMALGAFLAGVLLADTEYRHELEANIEPFKGLLLGLFFIAVGMSVNLGLIMERPLMVLALVLGLVTVKVLLLYGLARRFGMDSRHARALSLYMPQGGEFAFVLFGVAVGHQVMARELADLLIMVVSVSMALTPLLLAFNERVLAPRQDGGEPPAFDTIEEEGDPVIIAGFGRVGQIVGRILRLRQIPFTALEISPSQVDFVRKYGGRLYYGDASRLDLLRAAHAEKAQLFVLAIDDIQASIQTAQTVKRHFPHLEIMARARNRRHAHLLMDLGVKVMVREAFFSSMELTRRILIRLGLSEAEVERTLTMFRRHDEKTLVEQHAVYHDESMLLQSAREAASELEALFESDRKSDRPPSSE